MARKKKSESESDTDYETDAEVDAADDAEAAEYERAAERVKHDYEADTDADTGPDMVEVEIVVDHVFLPVGEDGNVPAVWREAPTVRVGKGTKLTVPTDMLEMLGDKVKVSP